MIITEISGKHNESNSIVRDYLARVFRYGTIDKAVYHLKRGKLMFTQRKILVVEDNEINRMMLSAILSSEYEVLEAENGQAALAVLRKYRDGIALILLDIIMPVMDGYTFLARMQEDPALASIPVIVTTQSDDESDEVTALSHGATDFVAKPYKTQVILHRVANIIKLRETAAMINLIPV